MVKKVPAYAAPSNVKKSIHSSCASCQDASTATPSWRFSRMALQTMFRFPENREELDAIFSKLAGYETRTLSEMRGARGNNPYAVYDLGKVGDKIDKRVMSYMSDKLPDFGELHRFRFDSGDSNILSRKYCK